MIKRKSLVIIILILFIICIGYGVSKKDKEYMIVYSTDLFMDGDFDDYFDLISIGNLDNIDLEIILDDGSIQSNERGGATSIDIINKLSKRNFNYIIGESRNYNEISFDHESAEDILSQDLQNLIKKMKNTSSDIIIVTTGSLRDIAIMYELYPELFYDKVKAIYVFAGDYKGTYVEHNVNLDELAFLSIMNSGLPIYWIPCFENGLWTQGENSSYIIAPHNQLFMNNDSQLLKWFLYRYVDLDISFESFSNDLNLDKVINDFLSENRNLWSGFIFPYIDKSIYQYLNSYNKSLNKNIGIPFGFEEQKVLFKAGGVVEIDKGNKIKVLNIYNRQEFLNFGIYTFKEILCNYEKEYIKENK